MKTAHYLKNFMLVAIVLAVALQKGSGFVLVLLLPFFLLYFLFNAVRMARRPGERRTRCIRLAIWSVALALAGTTQMYRGAVSRSDAESALGKVLAHREQKGKYPASLGEVGLDARRLQDERGLRYFVEKGIPTLAYPAPFLPLTLREYDFGNHKWRYNAY